MQKSLLISGLLIMFGCTNQQKNDELENRINKLEQENKTLKETLSRPSQPSSYEDVKKFESSSNNYVFTRLIVEQEEYATPDAYTKVPVERNYCSMIKEYTNVDSDLKYRLMDEIQSRYLSSPVVQLKHGKVKSRECFVFATYEEASKKREEFIIDKE